MSNLNSCIPLLIKFFFECFSFNSKEGWIQKHLNSVSWLLLRLVFTSDGVGVGVVVGVISRRPYDLVKIENRGRKQSHKLDAIGVGRIRTFPFLPIPFTTTPSLMIQWKLGCRGRKQKRKNQPIAKSGIEHCHWFILSLLLTTPTMQFSLDRKQRRHKQNQSVLLPTPSVWFSLDRIALPFWLRLRLRLRR